MVNFKTTITSSGTRHLIILDNETQSLDKGTRLAVYPPAIGKYAEPVRSVTNEYRLDEWTQEVTLSKNSNAWVLKAANHHKPAPDEVNHLPTLGRRIIMGTAGWGGPVKFTGEFHYTKGYWEWTEDVLSRCKHTLKHLRLYHAVFASLFTYDCNSEIIKAFCEAWCPTTNTLLTSFGEMSISLWDVYNWTELPLIGYLYDEVVPDKQELCDRTGDLRIPESCKHLLHAYHLLCSDSNRVKVSIDQWVCFWSSKALRYEPPPVRSEKKKNSRPKLTFNPSGILEEHKSWTPAEVTSFRKLGIPREQQEETYLAAHLVCWLCTFVLPNDEVDLIRPGTFKMACLMASGKEVGLVVPVLANIYKGLNRLSKRSRPSEGATTFPVHFVYAWLAQYFKTHFPIGHRLVKPAMVLYSGENGAKYYNSEEARKRIYKGDQALLTCNTRNEHTFYVDNGVGQWANWSYFVAIRSTFLPWRQGMNFFVEPYSPHRFSRQFGYYQGVPGALKIDNVREVSLAKGSLYWKWCTSRKSFSKACLPTATQNAKRYSSPEYKRWWAQVHGTYLEDHISDLINLKSSEGPWEKVAFVDYNSRDDHDQGVEQALIIPSSERVAVPLVEDCKRKSVSQSEGSHSDRHWKRNKKVDEPHEPKTGPVKIPEPAKETAESSYQKALHLVFGSEGDYGSDEELSSSVAASTTHVPFAMIKPRKDATSVFVGEKFVENHQRSYVFILWKDFIQKILDTPLDSLSSMKEQVPFVMQEIKKFDKVDSSASESVLIALFDKADAYDVSRSKSHDGVSKATLTLRLTEARDSLRLCKEREVDESNKLKIAVEELKRVEKELDELNKTRENIFEVMQQCHQSLQDTKIKTQTAEENLAVVNNTSILEDSIVEELKISRSILEAALADLKNAASLF